LSIIRACVLKWAPDAAEEVLIELNEKLLDLNRRSLLHKLEILQRRWNVPLGGSYSGCTRPRASRAGTSGVRTMRQTFPYPLRFPARTAGSLVYL